MQYQFILAFLLTTISSLILTPISRRVGTKLDIVSVPGNRHVHKTITPRVGGLAIVSSFMIGSMFFINGDTQVNALLIGGTIIALCGALDDLIEMSAKYKLLFQIIAALVIIFYGNITLSDITIPGVFSIQFGYLNSFVTLIWIIAICNAINLVDGLDGLCGGLSIIILMTILMLSYIQGRLDIVLISILLIGSIFGFLFYNFHPASVFMGDTGSLFIGFMIACLSLMGFKSSTFLTLGPSLFILAVPIIDTLLSILRRKIKGVPIMSPDKEHLHHTLMYKFHLSHMKTVIVIYGITFFFSQVAFAYYIEKKIALIMMIGFAVVFELFIEKTGMVSEKYRPVLNLVDTFRRKLKIRSEVE